MRLRFPVDLEESPEKSPDEHCFAVQFADLPEGITAGDTRDEALINAIDCLEEVLAGRINDRDDIPLPSPAKGRPTVAPGPLIAAKTALYLALRESGVSHAELARRIGVQPTVVQRLLNPRHGSRIDQLDDALAALGKRMVLSIEDAA